MTLKNAYYDGQTGLQQQMADAFAAGVAYVGTATSEVSTLNLGAQNGVSFTTGSTGLYFDISSVLNQMNYRFWFFVATETAPAAGGRTLVQVNVANSDTSAQVAVKLANAALALTGNPFDIATIASVLQFTNTVPGASLTPPNIGTVGGSASIAITTPGVNSTGNYSELQNGLQSGANQGLTNFCVQVMGTGSLNGGFLRANNGNNLLLKTFFAGIQYALATEMIYYYECSLSLDVSKTTDTNVNFNFMFGQSTASTRTHQDDYNQICVNTSPNCKVC